jgi:hypothetical protein
MGTSVAEWCEKLGRYHISDRVVMSRIHKTRRLRRSSNYHSPSRLDISSILWFLISFFHRALDIRQPEI